ncbi:hypothetical protein ACFVYT_35980 [Streptomyces sp. NPDC058290]|uniref:hypothetical protein n=1 Tax=Streptomyces sp. NPDC058290 TaxID=3346426 RepID=UPI0036F150A1
MARRCGETGRDVLPYLVRIVNNLANDAYGIPSRPADEDTMKDLERHILAQTRPDLRPAAVLRHHGSASAR